MDCPLPLSGSEDPKGRAYELKSSEEDHGTPGKVSSKTDSQSTEEALDPDAVEFSVQCEIQEDLHTPNAPREQSRDGELYFRTRSESPESYRARSAAHKTQFEDLTEEQQHHDTAPTSPMHRFDLPYEMEDSRDEVRSESGGVRSSRGRGARGRGRGVARPCSGTATPLSSSLLVNTEKKRTGRGRGCKRGRGYGLSRVGDAGESEVGSSAPTTSAEDVYEFKSSPESECTPSQSDFGNHDERERSVPPSAKRQRLTETRPESHAGSAHSGEIEMDEVEEDEGNSKHSVSDRKVPPLRISLPITQSEEDVQGEHSSHQHGSGHIGSNKKGPRGRHGKRHNDADEAQRMTRSKVRQTGRALDDTDAWTKKRRGRVNVPSLTVGGDEVDESTLDDTSPIGDCSDDASFTCQTSSSIPDSLTAEQRLIYENPRSGMFRLKRMLASRWLKDLRQQNEKSFEIDGKFKNMLLLTGNYSLLRFEGTIDKEQANADANACKKEFFEDSAINGDVESEDESNGICQEMKSLWKEHSAERSNMMNRMHKEKIKLRLFWEEELLRKEQREKGTTPLMSAVRFLRENEMCNAQILEEPTIQLKAINQAEFTERRNKSINQMFNRHKMEASSLFGAQRDMWLYEARRRGLDVSSDWVKKCVPMVKVEKMEFPY